MNVEIVWWERLYVLDKVRLTVLKEWFCSARTKQWWDPTVTELAAKLKMHSGTDTVILQHARAAGAAVCISELLPSTDCTHVADWLQKVPKMHWVWFSPYYFWSAEMVHVISYWLILLVLKIGWGWVVLLAAEIYLVGYTAHTPSGFACSFIYCIQKLGLCNTEFFSLLLSFHLKKEKK